MNYREIFNRIILIAWSTIAVILVMGSFGLHTTEANSLFKASIVYKTSDNSNSVAISDLNGDGNSDLAVANGGVGHILIGPNGNVSVLLGNGDGSFQSAVNYDTGYEANSVAIGDLNGDGNPDLAVTNYGWDPVEGLCCFSVSVLLGNGDGTFQSAVNYGVGAGPSSVAIGDLNGDGNPDLATANSYTGLYSGEGEDVSVLLGNGDGTFQSAVNYDTDVEPSSVAIGDLDGDGDLDLVTDGVDDLLGNGVHVMLGNGDGTFQSATHYDTEGGSVALGDLDGDGNLDLATSDVSVLLGNGDGTFQAAVNYAADGDSVAIGDLDGDGNLDLATSGVSILINISTAIVNDFVTFDPDPSTYLFTPDTTDCQAGAVGKFTFDATLTNISIKELSNLKVEVDELTNNNLLLTDNGLIGEGGQFEVPKIDDYADGYLSADEYVDVPFTVCLKEKKPFRFFVNVAGVAAE
jgi:hypothetical protein